MKTWEEFIELNIGHVTEVELTAIHYGLCTQGILDRFLMNYDGRWYTTRAYNVLDSCLVWSNTKEGSVFWVKEHDKFLANFDRYLSAQYKKPSLFRDRIKELK